MFLNIYLYTFIYLTIKHFLIRIQQGTHHDYKIKLQHGFHLYTQEDRLFTKYYNAKCTKRGYISQDKHTKHLRNGSFDCVLNDKPIHANNYSFMLFLYICHIFINIIF